MSNKFDVIKSEIEQYLHRAMCVESNFFDSKKNTAEEIAEFYKNVLNGHFKVCGQTTKAIDAKFIDENTIDITFEVTETRNYIEVDLGKI